MRRRRLLLTIVFCGLACVVPLCRAVEFPGPEPGRASARLDAGRLVMENNVLSAAWDLGGGKFALAEVVDRIAGAPSVQGGEAFVLVLENGEELAASKFLREGEPKLQRVEPEPDSVQASRRFGGWRATMPLVSRDGKLRARWCATLRDGSNGIIQQFALETADEKHGVREVILVDVAAPGAKVAGEVDGSPVVAGGLFFAVEHPTATSRVEKDRARCSARVYRLAGRGDRWSRSAVLGVVPPGQLRRGFLYYVERERARPYQLFLHYNSWWDIAWTDRKMNEEQCLDVIERFGRELTEKRGVRLDSFCFDDGWDDNKTLWQFHGGFPGGFAPLKAAAEKYGSALGVWLSPWGGYGQAKDERIDYGKTQGFETNARGFSLDGPKYRARYRDICVEMIKKYGVNFFKYDGIAQGIDSRGAGAEFSPDVESLLELIRELRRHRPDVFVSNTTGTWPSPYWLFFGDSIWRNGHDWNVHGTGPKRQQWITYRDMIVHRMIARRAPLYPLNSLMTVTVCYAQLGTATEMTDDVDDLIDELRMGFGSGTQTYELYLTPRMMKPAGWDTLAEAAHWARGNGDVLADVHWIGGDPGEGRPYGYASWSPRKGILALRNPSESPAAITIDAAAAFELPPAGAKRYLLRSPWKGVDRPQEAIEAGKAVSIPLRPLETLLLEAIPAE
ncbi:MAG: enterotoxin [Pirellulales bacterium]|nr:enterotoxin [Pirellulales bacterium]